MNNAVTEKAGGIIVERQERNWKVQAFVLIAGVPILLLLAVIYNVLSLREWAIGIIELFAVVIVWASAQKKAAKKHLASGDEPRRALDDKARKRMLRDIRQWKVWIGVLIVLLPIGIVNGASHRAWLPTLVGIGISLTLIYIFVRQIKQQKERLNLAGKQ